MIRWLNTMFVWKKSLYPWNKMQWCNVTHNVIITTFYFSMTWIFEFRILFYYINVRRLEREREREKEFSHNGPMAWSTAKVWPSRSLLQAAAAILNTTCQFCGIFSPHFYCSLLVLFLLYNAGFLGATHVTYLCLVGEKITKEWK